MLIGAELDLFPEWRLVEADLYNITGRVREYDPDARLVVNDDHHLGLARFVRNTALFPGGVLIFARTCVDWTLGLEDPPQLMGEPDARVLWDMRATDSHRIKNMDSWNRKVRDYRKRQDARGRLGLREWNREQAERFVNIAHRKDLGYKPTIRVPKAVA